MIVLYSQQLGYLVSLKLLFYQKLFVKKQGGLAGSVSNIDGRPQQMVGQNNRYRT